MTDIDASVAICTWNRADLLSRSLERFVGLRVPSGFKWELMVVDNACTDHTRAVIESLHDRLPIRYVHEPRLGLSNARNCAADRAQGRFIIWADDDVLVDSNWLVAYANGFENNPQAVVFGGSVEPCFEVLPPVWMTQAWPMISRYHAIRSVPEGGGRIEPKYLPNGANFAIRTDVQRQFRYDPSQGRRGEDLFSGEESSVIREILTTGGVGVWLPDARVQHYLPASRMTLKYLRRTVRDTGRQSVQEKILSGRSDLGDALFLGSPRWLWRKALEMHIIYFVRRLGGRPERWMPSMLRASRTLGEIRGYREHRDA